MRGNEILGRAMEFALDAPVDPFGSRVAPLKLLTARAATALDSPRLYSDLDREVRARVASEERLRRSEAYLACAQRLGATGTFVWRPNESTIDWSDEMYHITGVPPGTPISPELALGLIHADDLPELASSVRPDLEAFEPFDWECRIRLPNDEFRTVRLVARRSGPEIIGAAMDVTERKRAEAAARTLQEQLAQAHRVGTLGEMAGSIAHEVNQPLTGIVNNARACLRWLNRPEPALDEAREAIQRITRDAKRTTDIVAGLRSLFCKSVGRKSAQHVDRLIAEVLDFTRRTTEDAAVTVRTRFADDLPTVHADKVQIQQVLLNLVLNAVDAMRATEGTPRELTLTVRALDARQVQLEVRDSGVGFAPGDTERIFEAFYTTKPNGMGMGLSISRSIVHDHGGELRAHPNHDACGATFAFALPTTPSKAPRTARLR